MAFKIVLILAIIAQVAAAGLALRLNKRYRWYSAWILISGAAGMLSVLEFAVLLIVWRTEIDILEAFPLWTACLSALLVSVLFVGGVSLIEPLFIGIAKAEDLLQKENRRLENVVQQTEEELRLARQIQERLLPTGPPQLPGFEVAGCSVPAEWTSGDYFDYIPMSDGTLAVVIADVSGHGTGPALLMTATRAYLRALSQTNHDVGDMLTTANRAIADDVDRGRFVTIFLARINPEARTLVYASAGHDGLLLKKGGETKTLNFGGPPLGVLSDSVIENAPQEKLDCGDLLLLASDGLPETESPSGEQFGIERMIGVVRTNRKKSAEDIVDKLLQSVRQFAGDTPQRDDITAVLIKVL